MEEQLFLGMKSVQYVYSDFWHHQQLETLDPRLHAALSLPNIICTNTNCDIAPHVAKFHQAEVFSVYT